MRSPMEAARKNATQPKSLAHLTKAVLMQARVEEARRKAQRTVRERMGQTGRGEGPTVN